MCASAHCAGPKATAVALSVPVTRDRQLAGWSPQVGHWQYALRLNLAISSRVVEPWRDMHFVCVCVRVFATPPTHHVVAL
jgi:hypothetical protein